MKKEDSIEKYYTLEAVIGEGSFATVRKAIKKKNNEEVAVKIIKRDNLKEEDEVALRNEVEILSQIDHPNVVKFFELFEDEHNIYLVLEYMSGGKLFDRIVEKEHYSEKEAADTIRPIVDAIKYCHSLGIVHRDLKPENLLYQSPDSDAAIKISDFGLARFASVDMMMTTCGTPGYVAPEILKGKGYTKAVDFWSIGVILYILLCGFPPFYAENNLDLFEIIKKGEYEFPSPYWDMISDLAKDLIRNLLVVDPSKRYDANKVLVHPWIVGEKTPRKQLPSVTTKMREFNALKAMPKLGPEEHKSK